MEHVPVEVRLPGQIEPDVLALPVLEDPSGAPSNGARTLDEQLGGRLSRLVAAGELRGELGKATLLHTDGEVRAKHVVATGVGRREDVDADAVRTAAAAVARSAAEIGGDVAWLIDETLPLDPGEQARAVVEGL